MSVINVLSQNVILLLRSALKNEKIALPDDFDLPKVFEEMAKHYILSIGYVGALNCGVDKNDPTMQRLERAYYTNLLTSERQTFTVERICSAFEEKGIEYMLLKGCNLKKLYPRPEMRRMGDADILIHECDYEAAKSVVMNLGFSKDDRDGAHTRNFISDVMYLELHICLVAKSEYPRYADYLGDGWQRAELSSRYRYVMKPEDELIFLFIHFVKHYVSNGIGCRHICDLWIFMEKNKGIDYDYVENEMKKLELFEFYKNVTKMLKVWFEGEKPDEKTDAIGEYVFKCGVWGTKETVSMGRSLRSKQAVGSSEKVRRYTVLQTIFPPISILKKPYPVLEKCPLLLPFVWIIRWIGALISPRRISAKIDEFKRITPQKIDDHEEFLRFVGLNSSK